MVKYIGIFIVGGSFFKIVGNREIRVNFHFFLLIFTLISTDSSLPFARQCLLYHSALEYFLILGNL